MIQCKIAAFPLSMHCRDWNLAPGHPFCEKKICSLGLSCHCHWWVLSFHVNVFMLLSHSSVQNKIPWIYFFLLFPGESPSKDIPSYYHTRPASNTIGQSLEEPTFSRRQRGDMAGGDTGVQDNDVPKLRQVYKRVQLRRGEPRNKNISPWCRPTRRRWKKVLVWVDEFGREVKPPGSSEEDTECEEDKKDDEKDNPAEESSQRTTRRSQESSHAGSTPHKPADNTSASAAAEEGESEFTLNSRRVSGVMVQCKTAVSPVHQHWRYCRLEQTINLNMSARILTLGETRWKW